jgi:AcrR family transcriptional regulator
MSIVSETAPPLSTNRAAGGRLSVRDRRRSIVQASTPLFARKGFDGTTTREIASAAGVSEALLYRHFASKEALHDEILESMLGMDDPTGDRIRALPPSTSSLVQLLTHLVQRCCGTDDLQDSSACHRLMLGSCIGDPAFARATYARILSGYFPAAAAAMRAAEQAGDLVPGPISPENRFWFVEHLASMMVTVCLSGSPVVPYDGATPDIVRQAVWFCCRGIGLTDAAIEAHLPAEVPEPCVAPALETADLAPLWSRR